MSRIKEEYAKISTNITFRWGRKERLGGKNHNIQYYESFMYDDVEYSLYDSVYLYTEGQPEPYIGKIIEIYETSRLQKLVNIVWYFRPTEIQKWLKGIRVLNNELFLGSGEGFGLSNINFLETISGKCSVICTSKDQRNPKEELKTFEYLFSRTFDVKTCRISERFPDKIAGVDIGHFFNPTPKVNSKVTNKIILKIPSADSKIRNSSSSASDSCNPKKRKLQEFQADEVKPKLDTSKWFKKIPWEERLQKAQESGSVILLENLYPTLTSLDVEEIVMIAFNKKVSAKMIQHTAISNPNTGQALVIFNSKDEADFAISRLKTKCLMIGGVRPVIGSRPSLKEAGNHHPSKYFGHNTMKLRQRIETNNAVSTSHYSQPNTFAFDMAMEWRWLQKKYELCLDALYEQQGKEIGNLRDRVKATPTKKR